MDTDITRLADALEELAAFLAAHDEPFWADWVGQDARRIRQGDGYGVTHFLSAFGGMGSLNDVTLAAGGDATDDGRALDERFDTLRRSAWELAQALHREAR
jgi:hypothetical protein